MSDSIWAFLVLLLVLAPPLAFFIALGRCIEHKRVGLFFLATFSALVALVSGAYLGGTIGSRAHSGQILGGIGELCVGTLAGAWVGGILLGAVAIYVGPKRVAPNPAETDADYFAKLEASVDEPGPATPYR